MSLLGFQTALARLVTEPAFREAVRVLGGDALDASLCVHEKARLCQVANDAGLGINRTLHKGFRLGKLRAVLPLTCRVLTSQRLAREVAAFWQVQPPASFYFIGEAIQFCDFLGTRRLRIAYLAEVVAYERATLELERAQIGPVPAQRVVFRHDPAALLGMLARGQRPRGVARRACTALGHRDPAGQVHWHLDDHASA